MPSRKLQHLLIRMLMLGFVLAACTSEQQPDPEQVAVIVALTQTAAAAEAEVPTPESTAMPGYISGQAYGFAPPTPPLMIYALDPVTGQWAVVETDQVEGQTPFTLEVEPGTYQVFACPIERENCAFGYSEDGGALSTVTVSAGQTISDILVRPPGMGECGPRMGFPASPDGRFQAVEPPTEDCPTGELQPLQPEACVDLAAAAEQTLGIPFLTTQVPIEQSWSELV